MSKDGIDAGVINMPTVKPLDTETLIEAAKTSKVIVTAEEHSIIGGLGSAVAEFAAAVVAARAAGPLRLRAGDCDLGHGGALRR